jgi:hypothetical protein
MLIKLVGEMGIVYCSIYSDYVALTDTEYLERILYEEVSLQLLR